MSKLALYVPLEAKPGKEQELANFLRSALPLVEQESGTVSWFAIQEGPSSFAIFDTFDDESGRDIPRHARCLTMEKIDDGTSEIFEPFDDITSKYRLLSRSVLVGFCPTFDFIRE